MDSEKIKYSGVYIAKKKNGTIYYRSSFTYKNKHISLGSFQSPKDANHAYLEALNLVSNQSIDIYDYDKKSVLSFEKWVVIINFRDNNIYFPTPIYMRKKYFSYYLSLNQELKFSIDDLFYYASHKIMKRGNHLFVADYGMQVSIMSRYGVKNYAVYGNDYILLNNDPYDFRYENIKILNSYNGVKMIHNKNETLFQSKIHIHGDYIIGYFKDSLHAAIAYNKAVDILMQNGIKKSYKQNYTEGLSPSVYAEIYTKISIPQKIMNYRAE